MKACRRSRLGVAVTVSLVALAFSPAAMVSADDTLNGVISEAFTFSGTQLTVLAEEVLVDNNVFTDYTDTDGQWLTEDEDGVTDLTVWTSGMVAGMFWYQYEYTQDETWKTTAEFWTAGLEGVEELDDNDTGFQAFNSFGLGYRLTGEPSYKTRVLTGADTLYGNRYVSLIPAFWSWENPDDRPEWEMAVNVDMIMNMEIMLWAAANGGDTTYTAAVEGHADTTWRDIVRDDNSTYHVADYDPDTGDLVDQGTYQGWTDDSTWSRGQAWAVYGFVMVHRFTQEPRFLEYSLATLKYFDDNLPADNIPYSDFDAPLDANNSKDSSATAIVTSSLFELFEVTGDPAYLERAQTYMTALLSSSYYEPDATDGWQSILRRASARWGDPEVGAVFGDYFLLEAMVRYKRMAPSILLRDEEETVVAAGGSSSSSRKLSTLSGGSYCGIEVVDGKVVFQDPDCVPEAPVFAEDPETPAPTPSPAQAITITSSPITDAPVVVGTPSPTIAPTTSESTSMSVATGMIAFTTALDNDVDLTGLVDTSIVVVWFGITLGNVDLVPKSFTLESGKWSVSAEIEAPKDGWKEGANTVDFTLPAGTFSTGTWDSVKSVAVYFSASTKDADDATNTVTVNHLVLGHSLDL